MNIQKIKIMLSAAIVFLLMTACDNAPIEFDDFGKTACYFPYQTPARTIILGKYDEGFNDNDNLRQFEIGVVMSGVYKNNEDRKVFFELDTALMTTILNVKYMPITHYNIVTTSPVIIPKGDTKGKILVQLTDAFFNDPKTVSSFFILGTAPICNYAIPLRITKVEGLDSILIGKTTLRSKVGKDSIGVRVKAADWAIVPQDYTLFAVKYINKYHGNYLRRGVDSVFSTSLNKFIGNTVYRNLYVEKSEVVKVSTVDLTTASLPGTIRRYQNSDAGTLFLKLSLSADSCTIFKQSTPPVTYTLLGTGKVKFKENGDKWGGKARDVIYLDYAYTDPIAANNEKHRVKDTIVIRDRGVGFELFIPTLKP